jgi:malonyl CoA-acyl carrier protein transacylase
MFPTRESTFEGMYPEYYPTTTGINEVTTGMAGLTTGVTGVYPTGVYPTSLTTGVTGVYPTGVYPTGVYPTTGLTTGVYPTESLWNHPSLHEFSRLPRLFPFSGCNEQVIEKVIEKIQTVPTDLATHCLLQPTSMLPIGSHPYRGYTILNGKQTIREIKRVECVEPRPVCLVFNGIGSQWYGIGQELMTLDVFRQSIIRSVEVLKPYGVNLMELIGGGVPTTVFEKPLNSFVGITAIQIALVDCLRHIGIVPEYYIGHSVGELGCAYADYCLTAEEALLTAFHTGMCVEKVQWPSVFCHATVGLTWEECTRRCPTGIVPTWQVSHECVNVVGPKHVIVQFVKELGYEGIFAKVDETLTVPYHSMYMKSVMTPLRTVLEKIILTPKLRTSKWISTSIPVERMINGEFGRYSSPEYFVNNLCSPVLLNEALTRFPVNSVVVEVGPHAMLQSVLRRTLGQQVPVIPLFKKEVVYPLEHFLTQLGRLYCEGVNLDAVKLVVPYGREHCLYPLPVHVPTGPFAEYVKCDLHPFPTSGIYEPSIYERSTVLPTTGYETIKHIVDINEDMYLTGHQIEGRLMYPTTGYLHLIWKSLAQLKGYPTFEQMPVTFEDVEFVRQTVLPTVGPRQITFVVKIVPKTGVFELVESVSGHVIVTGRVFVPETVGLVVPPQLPLNWTTGRKFLECEEIYRDLKLRGYEYNGEFRPLVKCDVEGTYGELLWTGKWVPFMDAMLQMNTFGQKRGLLFPTRIRSLRIDPTVHYQTQKMVKMVKSTSMPYGITRGGLVGIERPVVLPIVCEPLTNKIVCGGVEIVGLNTIVSPVRHLINETYPTTTSPVTFPIGYPVTYPTTHYPTTVYPTTTPYTTCPTTVYPTPYTTVPTTYGMENVVSFNPIQTYVITGGLAGFGLELAHWMVERGARRIVITSKVGVRTEYQVKKLRILRDEFNAQIQVLPFDVTDEVECLTLIKEAAQMSIENRIGGIFHLSGLWEEMPYEIQQTLQKVQMQQQLRKIVETVRCLGAFNLDKYVRSEGVMDETAYFCMFVPVFGGRSTTGVIPTPYSTIEKICEIRRREGKHVLAIHWGFEKGMNTECVFGGETGVVVDDYPIVPRRIVPCLRVLESLLVKSCGENTIYSTYVPIEKILSQEVYYPTMVTPKSLVEYVFTVLGVKTTLIRNEQITLGELGLTNVMCVEIKKVLETMYNLPFTPREIEMLTIEKIKSIEMCQRPTRFFPTTFGYPTIRYPTTTVYPTTGVLPTGVYPTGVYPTGVLPTGVYPTGVYPTGVYPTGVYPTGVYPTGVYPTTVVPRVKGVNYLMPTRVVERLNTIELTPTQVPLVVIHPIEGHVEMLRSWAKNVNYPVFGVQFTKEAMQYETIEQLGEFYWTQIEREIFTPTTVVVPRVHLVGFSFGGSVAYEMAVKRNNRIASLTFLDGCHQYVDGPVTMLKQKIWEAEKIHEIESELLTTFFHQYVPVVSRRELIEELIRLPTLEHRIRHVVRELLTKSQYQFDQFDLELAARSYVVKMLMAMKYQPRSVLKLNELLLIKSLVGPTNMYERTFGPEYGLGQVFGGKLNVHVIDADQRTMFESVNGLKLANLFNEYLPRCF